jgi:hypothetical protein
LVVEVDELVLSVELLVWFEVELLLADEFPVLLAE